MDMKTAFWRSLISRYAILCALLVLAIIISILTPRFLLPQNLLNVGMQISINAIISVGMTCVILTGGIDLSVGPIAALAGLLASMFVKKAMFDSTFVMTSIALLLALGVGLVCGLFNGVAVSKLRVTAFITTLATMSIIRGICFLLTNSKPIFGLPDTIAWIGQGYVGLVPVAVIVMAIIIISMGILLKKTRIGRYVYAVGSNEEVARLSGINTTHIKVFVYAVSGALSALGGFILMSRLQTGQPNAAVGYELQAIAATVVGGTKLSGGRGTVVGTLTGALIIGILNNGMSLLQISSYWQSVFTGVVILGAVAFNELASGDES
ncbi:MAG: ABC transporter permease [Candidatus Atribacteria bacterium]|nr:ABC transporter permease [Candidatus Atribacteria bacterium]